MIELSHHTAAVALACALAAEPGQAPVKVHGVLATGSGGYVDLHNTSSRAVDLAGWTLTACHGRRTADLAVLPAGSALGPGDHLLVAGPDLVDGSVTVPAVTGDGHVLLDRRGARVDGVAVAPGSPCREDEAAPSCGRDQELARDTDSSDTDNNRRDFTCAPPPAG